jgi:hypothetical protein
MRTPYEGFADKPYAPQGASKHENEWNGDAAVNPQGAFGSEYDTNRTNCDARWLYFQSNG